MVLNRVKHNVRINCRLYDKEHNNRKTGLTLTAIGTGRDDETLSSRKVLLTGTLRGTGGAACGDIAERMLWC